MSKPIRPYAGKRKAFAGTKAPKVKVYIGHFNISQPVAGSVIDTLESEINVQIKMLSSDTDAHKHADFIYRLSLFLKGYPHGKPVS